MKKNLIALFLGVMACSLGSFAYAVKGEDLKELNRKVDEVVSHHQSQSEKVAKALNQMSEIKVEFQSIKGQLQSSQYLEKESTRVYQDLDMRVSAIEDKLDQIQLMMQEFVQLKKTSEPNAVGGDVSKVLSEEQKDFQNLLAVFNAKDYHNAASGWMGFLKKYPQSTYANKAQYWLAESFYYLEDFAKSIQEFQTFIEKNPQDPRAKEAFYKQGMGFLRLKRPEQARLFFQKVVSDYPKSAEAYKATSRLKQMDGIEQNASDPVSVPPVISTSSESAENTPQDPSAGAPVHTQP